MNAKQMLIAKMIEAGSCANQQVIEARVLAMSWVERMKLYADLCVKESQRQVIIWGPQYATGTFQNAIVTELTVN